MGRVSKMHCGFLWLLGRFFFPFFEVCLTRKGGFGTERVLCYFPFVYVTCKLSQSFKFVLRLGRPFLSSPLGGGGVLPGALWPVWAAFHGHQALPLAVAGGVGALGQGSHALISWLALWWTSVPLRPPAGAPVPCPPVGAALAPLPRGGAGGLAPGCLSAGLPQGRLEPHGLPCPCGATP